MLVSKPFLRDFAYLANRYGWTPADIEEMKAAIRANEDAGRRYITTLVAAHRAGPPEKRGAIMPNKYDALFQAAGQAYNVDPRLLAAMMMQEIGGDPNAVSPKDATGLMQVRPDTAREMGFSDMKDPVQNVMAGAKYMSQQLDKYRDPALALAAYNAGPGAVDQHGGIPPYPETQRYVQRVLGSYQGAPAQAAQAMPGLPPTGNDSQAPADDHFSKFMDNAGSDDSITGAVDRVAAKHGGPFDGALAILSGQMPGLPPTVRNAQPGGADPFSKLMEKAGGDDTITGAIDRVAAKHGAQQPGAFDDALSILNGTHPDSDHFAKLMEMADPNRKIQYIDDSNNPNAQPGPGLRIEIGGISTSQKVLLDAKNLVGATVEPILTAATGALAGPIGGAVRLGSVALGNSYEDAKQAGEKTANMLTYHPQTVGGQVLFPPRHEGTGAVPHYG